MMKWWLENPMRMIQTNLREIDAQMDQDAYIKSLKEFNAEVVLFNMGGIVANYQTKLDCHHKNTFMTGDFAMDILSKVHNEGMRLIARFDFSKVNEAIGSKNQSWLYRSISGNHVNYNGQMHTCLNGYYQQECSLKILSEVIDNYPIDGVFFNLFGYNTDDYSGNYHGICQCENCSRRFKAMYGETLPTHEDENDPVYRKYVRFCRTTSMELQMRITAMVKSKNDDLAICNYSSEGVDIFRHESYTSLDERLPEWNFSGSQNNKEVYGSWLNKASSNTAVHFLDLPFRHAAVSPNLTAARLAQDIANCGWVDYYVIGTLNNQDDRLCFDHVKSLFKFHHDHEEYFTGCESVADVCILYPRKIYTFASIREFRGIYRILSQHHVLFDVMDDNILEAEEAGERLSKYRVIILPETRCMSDASVKVVDNYARAGGKVLVTGASSSCSADGSSFNRIRLACTGAGQINRTMGKEKGTYLRIREGDKGCLKGFDKLDILYLFDDFFDCSVNDSAKTLLGFMPACMFGPPEKCYYTVETKIPGVIYQLYGSGKGAIIPWKIGTQYEDHSYHGHAMLLMSVLNDVLGYQKSLSIDASPMVEITSHANRLKELRMVSLVNLSGQLGTAFLPYVEMRDIRIRTKTDRKPVKVYTLCSGDDIDFNWLDQGEVEFTIPSLGLLEIIVIEYQAK